MCEVGLLGCKNVGSRTNAVKSGKWDFHFNVGMAILCK